MNDYTINILLESGEYTETWSGYDEKTAIAQCFLYHAQNGAREIKVLSIELK